MVLDIDDEVAELVGRVVREVVDTLGLVDEDKVLRVAVVLVGVTDSLAVDGRVSLDANGHLLGLVVAERLAAHDVGGNHQGDVVLVHVRHDALNDLRIGRVGDFRRLGLGSRLEDGSRLGLSGWLGSSGGVALGDDVLGLGLDLGVLLGPIVLHLLGPVVGYDSKLLLLVVELLFLLLELGLLSIQFLLLSDEGLLAGVEVGKLLLNFLEFGLPENSGIQLT